MRIAIVQMMYPKGHQRLDEEFVKLLATKHQLLIVDDGKYFKKELCKNSNIDLISVFQPYSKRCEPLKRFLRRLSLLIVLLKLNGKHFDELLFLNCHNTLYKYEKYLPKTKRVIIHHADIDALFANNHDYNVFSKVKEKFYHVFLADYIRDNFIEETGIDGKFSFTIHQPLVFGKDKHEVEKENLMVGIGNSTDEDFISKIVSLDKRNRLINCPNKLILRSKRNTYDGQNVKVISGYLSREEYERLYEKAKVSVVNYPQTYKYRYSGIIDDSLSKGLVVYSNDTLCGRYFAKHYPNSVIIIDSAEHLWKLMQTPLPSQPKEETDIFQERHSAKLILDQFDSVFNS